MKDIPILYDDDAILVVNKPCGIACQGGEGVTVSILDILERQTGTRIYPVHRLDKDTAGILVVALSSAAAAEYSGYIASGSLSKNYRAVCFGVPREEAGVIKVPAGRHGNEKPAETSYRVESSATEASLVSLGLVTGRMHQIRIHLASIGCPIVADDKYGDFAKNRAARSSFGVRKLQLAAYSLEIPVAGKRRRFTAPLPDHMVACLAAFGLSEPRGI
jgi:23S rRNA pseudouridine955/2504/2580 synthase